MTEQKRRGRPPKARVEGESQAVVMQGSEAERRPDPVPGNNGEALARIVEYFKAAHPEAWAELHLCPLEYALEEMVNRLR